MVGRGWTGDRIAVMKALVTGSSGHIGEALARTFSESGKAFAGLDIKPSAFTTEVGSIVDRDQVGRAIDGVDAIFHTATLHKPHVVTHPKQAFLDTNVSGTLALLEAAVERGVGAFIFTSTTSVYGDALRPLPGEPAVWVTEELVPQPKNIYGVTKLAAEELCRLFHRIHGLNVVVLRTSRFFPEEDDDPSTRSGFSDRNAKANELLFRRVDLQDVVAAHLLASERAQELGFGRYIVSATTPFRPEDRADLIRDPAGVVQKRVPGFSECFRRENWRMFGAIERVYVNESAQRDLDWHPRYDFAHLIDCLDRGEDCISPLAKAVGSKGYHEETFEDGPYPLE